MDAYKQLRHLLESYRSCPLLNHGNNRISSSDVPNFQFRLVEATRSRHCMELQAKHHLWQWRAWTRKWSCCQGIYQSAHLHQSDFTKTRTLPRFIKSKSATLSRCWCLLVQVMCANVNSTRRPQLMTLHQTFHKRTHFSICSHNLHSRFRFRCGAGQI